MSPRKKRDPTQTHRHKRETKRAGCYGCGEPTAGLYCPACRVPALRSVPEEGSGPGEPSRGRSGRRERLEIIVPWDALISDNERHGVINGRIMLTRAYRKAKKAQKEAAKLQVPHPHPHLKGRVRLTARVYFPDTEEHDVTNLAKATHDALEGVIYKSDAQIKEARWIDAGVDPLHPRCELVIEVYVEDAPEERAAA